MTYSGVSRSRVRADLQAERWVTGEWTARKECPKWESLGFGERLEGGIKEGFAVCEDNEPARSVGGRFTLEQASWVELASGCRSKID